MPTSWKPDSMPSSRLKSRGSFQNSSIRSAHPPISMPDSPRHSQVVTRPARRLARSCTSQSASMPTTRVSLRMSIQRQAAIGLATAQWANSQVMPHISSISA